MVGSVNFTGWYRKGTDQLPTTQVTIAFKNDYIMGKDKEIWVGKATRPLQENPILTHCSENKILISIIIYKSIGSTFSHH